MLGEGEHVICAFCGKGPREGTVLGAIYDDGNGPPIPDRDSYSILFEDKTQLIVDRKNHIVEIKDSFGSFIRFADGNIYIKSAKNVYIN